MGLHKGQKNNPHGRPKGSSNKLTLSMRERIQGLVNDNFEQLEVEFKALDAKDKWTIAERLIQYTTPKMQSLDTESQVKLEYSELERLLRSAPDEAVQRIADKVMELQKISNEKK